MSDATQFLEMERCSEPAATFHQLGYLNFGILLGVAWLSLPGYIAALAVLGLVCTYELRILRRGYRYKRAVSIQTPRRLL